MLDITLLLAQSWLTGVRKPQNPNCIDRNTYILHLSTKSLNQQHNLNSNPIIFGLNPYQLN